MTTLGLALVELWMLYASFMAKDFRSNPTPHNLTEWCNAMEMVEHTNTNERIAA